MSKTNTDKKLYLVDAFAMIYRAYFAYAYKGGGPQGGGLVNSKGVDTSATLGFTTTLWSLLSKDKPTHIAVVFDAPGPTDRAAEFDFYKANREAMPEAIRESLPWIKKIVDAFHIPRLELAGYEADDLIGTLAKKAEKDGYEVFMVTPDKDYGQLVSENIHMYKPAYKGGGFEVHGLKEVLAKWEIKDPLQVIDILGLMGDSVDNIPGVPGVGEKTAIKLLKQYDSIEGLYEHADEIKGKLGEKIRDNQDKAIISKQLATIIVDAPVNVDEEDLVVSEPNRDELANIFAELEFRTLGKTILGDSFNIISGGQGDLFGGGNGDVSTGTGDAKSIESVEHNYILVDSAAERKKLIAELSKAEEVCFDTETTGVDPNNCEMVGFAFSLEEGKAWYVPVPEDQNEALGVINEFKPLLENEKIRKVGQNLKYDIIVLKWYGVEVKGQIFDTMLAHYCLRPHLKHGMDTMAEDYLQYSTMSIEELIGKKGKAQKSMRDVDMNKIVEYAGEDADVTVQLKNKFEPMLKEEEVQELYSNVEAPLINVLAAMEFEGVGIDPKFLSDYSEVLGKDALAIRDKIYEQAGHEFNLNSPRQLGTVLFDEMKIPYTGSKTATGQYSTNEQILSGLVHEHQIAADIMDYRELTKLKSTYVDSLPEMINPKTSRIHSSFRQAIVPTGRLSSDKPNLQNIPIRTERGRKIREAFIPRNDDFLLLSADYSQIELRIMAHMSEDTNMMEAFNNNADIHTATAAKVFGVSENEVTRELRSRAKAVNFGLIYGQTAFGLSQGLGISRGEAKEIMDSYFAKYPGIRECMDKNIQYTHDHGYIKTIMGRKRYLPDIHSKNNTVRSFAERNAINSPIQGSAADMIKLAMIAVHDEIKKRELKSKMILQVHDELVFDAHKTELDELKAIVEDKMVNAIPMKVPIVVEMDTGENWLQAH